jgi:glycine/D-amino acid oxidase-like deaminating enzyme
MKVDYIIVGLGLAGLAFAETLKENNKSFIVFENASQQSSKVAAGMFNPVVLKRFTAVWNGLQQLEKALPFFKKLETRFSKQYIYFVPIYRIFKSVEEQNNWSVACDKPLLSHFMEANVIPNKKDEIIAPFGFGKLINTGKLDIKSLLNDYQSDLKKENKIIETTFNHDELNISASQVSYKNYTAEKIVFCEGYGIKDNPFFNYLPLNEAKGELITIHAPNLKVENMLKAAVFVLPIGNDLYKVGATFNWKDKTSKPSKKGKKELIQKLNTVIKTDYKIVEHVAGIRPTVKDRRPLIGQHPNHKPLAILNGLGTRGVMLAPTMSEKLYDLLEHKKPLESEISIKRYETCLSSV